MIWLFMFQTYLILQVNLAFNIFDLNKSYIINNIQSKPNL